MDDGRGTVVVVTDDGDMIRRNWGVLLAIGIVAVVFGIVVLANIWGSVRLVAILAGLFLIFAGVMQFVSVRGRRRKTGRIVSGVIALVAGIVLVAWPDASVKTVAVIVGLSFLIWGIAWAAAALIDRGEGWGVAFGFSILLVVVGIVFMAWPGPTIAILMALVGLAAILFGVSSIAQALALRKA
jgi:uncharacterized membrane protein HdeD (DUF308 family)